MVGAEQPLTDQDLSFRFLAGRVGLALTATVGERWGRNFERLREPRDLARWLQAAELASGEVSVAESQLGEARALREAIYRGTKALISGSSLTSSDISAINRWAMVPVPAPQLRAGRVVEWEADDPVAAALGVVARDAIDLFAGRWASRIRECANDECALLFVDMSRPGKRRWCSSETCGSRSRSAAYRARVARRHP
jgi:predicted RNA-binding Zn ribbon-like protein